MNPTKKTPINTGFWHAIGTAILCGLHPLFTQMAADPMGDGLGAFLC